MKTSETTVENNETLEDIVADIRMQNQGLPEDANALSPLVCDLLRLADRIEAAAQKKTVAQNATVSGNAAAMREAVEDAKKKALYISRCYTTPNSLTGNILELLALLNAALAEPPRNCDVGTAEEQAKRFYDFCDGYMHKTGYKSCGTCPLWISGAAGDDCELKWAQMPYESEGSKE